ncbi:hypothetical protein K449DRAFT_463436 [Hypoxylon sp. EC38]|nr:hypothetical protein K449DRAFT_463436 [Hypoxylon sp. EC38]
MSLVVLLKPQLQESSTLLFSTTPIHIRAICSTGVGSVADLFITTTYQPFNLPYYPVLHQLDTSLQTFEIGVIARDVNSRGLLDSSGRGIGGPFLLKPDKKFSSHGFDFFDDFCCMRWVDLEPVFSTSGGVFSQQSPSDPIENPPSIDGELVDRPSLIVLSLCHWRAYKHHCRQILQTSEGSVIFKMEMEIWERVLSTELNAGEVTPSPARHHFRSTKSSEMREIPDRISSKRIASQPENAERRGRGRRRVFRRGKGLWR